MLRTLSFVFTSAPWDSNSAKHSLQLCQAAIWIVVFPAWVMYYWILLLPQGPSYSFLHGRSYLDQIHGMPIVPGNPQPGYHAYISLINYQALIITIYISKIILYTYFLNQLWVYLRERWCLKICIITVNCTDFNVDQIGMSHQSISNFLHIRVNLSPLKKLFIGRSRHISV